MAFTLITQRDRNANTMRSFNLTTPTVVRGLAWDGSFLWASGSADLQQLDVSTGALLGSVTATDTYDDLTFDGEYFWGPVTGNAGIGQITRAGQRVNFIGSLFSNSPVGIAYDGASLWVLWLSGVTGTFQISQVEMYSVAIDKTFNTGIASLHGLIFDGEFLVSHDVVGVARTLFYFDRSGTLVRTATEGSASGATTFNGLAFDGEYFYQGLSV